MQRYRFYENLQISVPSDLYKYSPGGSLFTLYVIVKTEKERSKGQEFTDVASVMSKIKPNLPEYHTRHMKKEFREKLSYISSVKPSVADFIYKELTLDESAVMNPNIMERIRLISLGEVGILPDMRVMNYGRSKGTFDVFFAKMGGSY